MTATHEHGSAHRLAATSVLSLVILLGVGGCGDDRDAGTRAPSESDRISVVDGRPFDEVFVVVDSLVLEESETVVTISPRVSPDPQGGFLVSDPGEHQVRLYSQRGNLEQVFGGDGTEREDSLDRPQRAKRLSNGDILVANLEGRLTLIPDRRGAASRFISTALRTIRNFEVLNEREVLLVGTDSAPPSATLFMLDLSAGRITKSFFPPPGHLDKWATTYFSTVSIARRGNRFVAAHMLSDTLVFFDHSGTELSRVGIPIDPFVAPIGSLPDLQTETERRAWTSQFTIISNVWWIEDDQLIVQWHKLTSDQGMAWGILRMDTSGVRAWAIAPAPYLLAVDGDQFFFLDPHAETLNRWLVAEERSKS